VSGLGARGARPAAVWFLVAAGLSDLGTGLALVAAPGLVLALLGIAGPGPTLAGGGAYLRFVGAFVAGVGAAYLYPFVPGLAPRPGRLATIAEVTALVRGGIALFLAGAVATGTLAAAWLLVAGFDAALAGAQVWMLRRGWIAHGVA
jgi:hypothetical protein